MSSSNRREFLAAGAGAVVGAVVGRAAQAQSSPANRVRHAIIGTGNQGRRHALTFATLPDCELVAICDLDPTRRKLVAEKLPNPGAVTLVDDFRRVLDDQSIDSVSVATPDHWHTPVALAALKAGKHVYVEKPCAHNIHEARTLAQAAQTSGKCVQQGTQGRSGESIKQAFSMLREGVIGKVRMAKAINHQLRERIGREPESAPPEGVNYDMWLGPAPLHAFTKNRWHYNWHWFWDYGCGDIGNDGIHQVDQARWGLGVGLPNAVSSSGGQLFYDDDHETPDTQVVTYEYDDCYLLYEMRLWTDYPMEGHDNGVIFYGDKGKLEIGRGGCDLFVLGEEKKHIGPYGDFEGHLSNFLACVRANNPAGLNGGIAEGAVSTTLCHLGNIATRVGRRLRMDADKAGCVDDAEANKLFKREYRSGYELQQWT